MNLATPDALVTKTLREQVYDYLRQAMNRGEITAGAVLNLGLISERLGISRTPLRDALIQLETEGFVSILPRRGVMVRPLGLDDIRHIYEMVGALEGAAVVSVGGRLGDSEIRRMSGLNREMEAAIAAGDLDTYYDRNLAFHDVVLSRSDNDRLVRTVENLEHRLYDSLRRRRFVAEWEARSIDEHAAFIDLLERGDASGAADYLRDVHWSFVVQEPFIAQHCSAGPRAGEGG